jgi:hypothetical protein
MGMVTVVAQKEKRKTGQSAFLEDVRLLFEVSCRVADVTEDVLDERGAYSKSFLKGLRESLKEAREGKVRRAPSLRGLQYEVL